MPNINLTESYLFYNDGSIPQSINNWLLISKYLRGTIRLVRNCHYNVEFRISHTNQGQPEDRPPVFIASFDSTFANNVLELEGLECHRCSCQYKYHIIRIGSEIRCENDISTVLLGTNVTGNIGSTETGETDSSSSEIDYSEIGETDSNDESSMPTQDSF